MGHFHDTIRGIGKNKAEAQASALADFFYENGHRYNLREVEESTFIRKVPPKKWTETGRMRIGERMPSGYIQWKDVPRMEYREDPSLPESDWLEEWEFLIHTHA